MRCWTLAFVAFVALVSARPAEACGGLFCSAVNPVVVDQSSERIIFELLEGGLARTTVDIVYQGRPEDFSWIVPVPEVPVELDVTTRDLMNALDQRTAPRIFPPAVDASTCPPPSTGEFFAGGCGVAAGAPVFDRGEGEGEGEIDLVRLDDVGPFGDIVVVDAVEVTSIFAFLEGNGYVLTDAMRPILRQYHDEGMKFLALRLQPGQTSEAIVPLRFTCPAEDGAVSIPLRLTAVAAEPEMSITVFILDDERYAPMNYAGLEIDRARLHMDAFTGRSNYFALVSQMVDEAGGRAFVTEASLPNVVLDVFDEDFRFVETRELPHVTRLYTRISAWEMTEDPGFAPARDRIVDNTFDLSFERAQPGCPTGPTVPLCGTTYCGPGARCVNTERGEACRCDDDQTARATNTPTGRAVICADDEQTDFLSDLEIDACAQTSCGQGRCEVVGGVATCRCNAGTAAALANDGSVFCSRITEEPEGDNPLDWTPFIQAQFAEAANNCAGSTSSGFYLPFGALALVLWGLRRLRRAARG